MRGDLGNRCAAMLKDGDRWFVGAMEKHLASPIEEVIFSWVEMCGGLEVVRRLDVLPILLIDLAEQVVKFSCVFQLNERLRPAASLVSLAEQKIRHRKIVSVFVGFGMNGLRLFQDRAAPPRLCQTECRIHPDYGWRRSSPGSSASAF